jgi:hypothetical protein
MKFHHAAALALAGWYLMVPTVERNKNGDWAVTATSQWNTLAVFDSAAECDRSQKYVLDRSRQELIRQYHATGTSSDSLVKSATAHATTTEALDRIEVIVCKLETSCIASDDPRLKEK